MGKTWSYITGKKGLNRVRVYEPYPGSPLWIEWQNGADERVRKSLREIAGHPVYRQEDAKAIANRSAQRLKKEARSRSSLYELVGMKEPHTLKELYDRLFASRAGRRWGAKWKKAQKRYRDFWYKHLGQDSQLRSVTADMVETAAAKAAEARGWSEETKRQYLVSITAAFTFAQDKLKWITEEHNLSAVDLPSSDSDNKELRYTLTEVFQIIDACYELDLRMAVIAEIAYATLRRKGAIRQLLAGAYQTRRILDEEWKVLVFGRAIEKPDKTSEAVLAENVIEVVERLLAKPAVQATGFLFPRGDLHDPDPAEKYHQPLASKSVDEWWRKAEKKAGVAHVDGRGIHGIKRSVTTVSKRVMGSLGAAAGQSGTTESTLENVYAGDDPLLKRELADQLGRLRLDGGEA